MTALGLTSDKTCRLFAKRSTEERSECVGRFENFAGRASVNNRRVQIKRRWRGRRLVCVLALATIHAAFENFHRLRKCQIRILLVSANDLRQTPWFDCERRF